MAQISLFGSILEQILDFDLGIPSTVIINLRQTKYYSRQLALNSFKIEFHNIYQLSGGASRICKCYHTRLLNLYNLFCRQSPLTRCFMFSIVTASMNKDCCQNFPHQKSGFTQTFIQIQNN